MSEIWKILSKENLNITLPLPKSIKLVFAFKRRLYYMKLLQSVQYVSCFGYMMLLFSLSNKLFNSILNIWKTNIYVSCNFIHYEHIHCFKNMVNIIYLITMEIWGCFQFVVIYNMRVCKFRQISINCTPLKYKKKKTF